jgi:hypothetical protein
MEESFVQVHGNARMPSTVEAVGTAVLFIVEMNKYCLYLKENI